VGVHPPANTRFWDAVFDTGHIFVFGIIAILGLKIAETLYPHASRRIGYYVFGFTLSLGIGVAVEIWQLYDPVRTFEVVDLVNDLIGCAAFLMWHRAVELGFRPPRARFQGVGLVVSAFALIILGLLPLARTWRDYGRRDAAFPVLMEFTGDWYWRFVWTKQARLKVTPPPAGWPRESGTQLVARVDAQRGQYPGLSVTEPYPDWRGYATLEIEVFSTSDGVEPFVLRVHDNQHNNEHNDRFNQNCPVHPGFQTLRFDLEEVRSGPTDRDLDMARIENLRLFISGLKNPLTFYVGQIRLTK
jgi:hypothetical protein